MTLIDIRSGRHVRSASARDLYVTAWPSPDRVLLARYDGSGEALWNLRTGRLRTLPIAGNVLDSDVAGGRARLLVARTGAVHLLTLGRSGTVRHSVRLPGPSSAGFYDVSGSLSANLDEIASNDAALLPFFHTYRVGDRLYGRVADCGFDTPPDPDGVFVTDLDGTVVDHVEGGFRYGLLGGTLDFPSDDDCD